MTAGAIVLTGQGAANKDGDSTAEGNLPFEMNLSPRNVPEIQQVTEIEPPTVFTSAVKLPVKVFPGLISSVVLPPSEPIQPLTAPESTPPPSAPDTRQKSPPAAGASSGRSPSKSPGNGHIAKRTQSTAPPKLLQAPPPRYPAKAKASKTTGKVAVLIRVASNGSAGSTSLYRSSGNTELDQAAVVAARGWKFSPSPTLSGGETIPVIVHVTFSL